MPWDYSYDGQFNLCDNKVVAFDGNGDDEVAFDDDGDDEVAFDDDGDDEGSDARTLIWEDSIFYVSVSQDQYGKIRMMQCSTYCG